jgi:plasmid maintenance system antidote protein VapI
MQKAEPRAVSGSSGKTWANLGTEIDLRRAENRFRRDGLSNASNQAGTNS